MKTNYLDFNDEKPDLTTITAKNGDKLKCVFLFDNGNIRGNFVINLRTGNIQYDMNDEIIRPNPYNA